MSERSSHYLIPDADVWLPSGPARRSFRIKDGRLAEMGASLSVNGAKVIDPRGAVLLPAGVDAQVHLRVPGQSHKETPETGIMAALRGGYGAVLTMPNTQPTIDSVATLNLGREQV